MSDKVNALCQAATVARFTLCGITGERDAEIRRDSDKVRLDAHKRWHDRINAATDHSAATTKEYQDALLAEARATSPLPIGARVSRWVREPKRWPAEGPNVYKRESGMVELWTHQSAKPGNMASYNTPPLGSFIVRAARKHGTIGKGIASPLCSANVGNVTLYNGWTGWYLDHELPPNPAIEEARLRAGATKAAAITKAEEALKVAHAEDV